jgi:sulfite reductase (ferredoxin)
MRRMIEGTEGTTTMSTTFTFNFTYYIYIYPFYTCLPLQDTFARLAEPLGYVAKDDIFHAVKAVVATQRDYGRRDDRRQSRLKYLVHSWGIDKFRTVTEQYFGKPFEAFKPLPAWEFKSYLGWGNDGAGKLWYGVYIQNGRVKGEGKKALRSLIEKNGLEVIITPQQNIILCDIDPSLKQEVESTLTKAGLPPVEEWDAMEASSMACPALPLCGLAVTEAERGLPDVNKRIRKLMNQMGVEDEQSVLVRMTGCPNG